jgi:hypothetical protein
MNFMILRDMQVLPYNGIADYFYKLLNLSPVILSAGLDRTVQLAPCKCNIAPAYSLLFYILCFLLSFSFYPFNAKVTSIPETTCKLLPFLSRGKKKKKKVEDEVQRTQKKNKVDANKCPQIQMLIHSCHCLPPRADDFRAMRWVGPLLLLCFFPSPLLPLNAIINFFF